MRFPFTMLSFGMANLTGFHGHFMAAPRRVKDAFRKGPHVFNLRHGITPDADPDTGQRMIDTVRGGGSAEHWPATGAPLFGATLT
jgi:hypothetical protein